MNGLVRFAWRSLRARPLRTALSIVGIALGVAVLFAALATDAGIQAGVGRTVDDVMGRSDLRVGAFEEKGLSTSSLSAIRSTPGVAIADPVLEQRTYLQRDALTTAGATAAAYDAPVTVIGIDPTIDAGSAGLHDLRLASGPGLTSTSTTDVLLPVGLAGDLGLRVGDSLAILGTNGPVPYKIVGLLAGGGPDPTSGGRVVVVPLAASAALFGDRGATWVDVGLTGGASVDGVAAALEQRLTFEPFVLTDRADLAASLEASTAGFQA
ncbi:MAG: ABC transporter permease, partial [Candidatus Limnocylindrales bacterium]